MLQFLRKEQYKHHFKFMFVLLIQAVLAVSETKSHFIIGIFQVYGCSTDSDYFMLASARKTHFIIFRSF